ncbi:acid protease [Metschnikowia bicuspidata var. bicuspidata NRRL YB-4993]|uniref:candidapepsin n=1 Tax=Metschnikowia bicuspidata var. bicuspidata NRRL YB-4993 TaxID=869754 RepID=A0A1A0H5X6_9ASCO|nr:acid protease [Metschnikowia bicuspidata var. bicuspidata NRRL YB-4993]OBA19436.1 acid protease [Metschnikowia bicuspidata var. bicuspidata NRRL YB-4993]
MQILAILSLALTLVQGYNIHQLEVEKGSSPLQLDFKVLKKVGNISAKEFWAKNKLVKGKRDAFAETIYNYQDLSYQINVFLGTNRKQNQVVIDTGSADLWIPSSGYDPAASNSSIKTGYPFSVSYLSGITAEGEFYLDSLSFGPESPALSNFQFAQATADGPGILGVADKNQEASPCIYDNLPWALKEAGITNKASYSLFLGASGESGTLIFGGIDTEKYTGELILYPIDQSTGRMALEIKSITFDGVEISVNEPALIDSGTSLGLLNQELMSELDILFNTTVVEENGLGYRFVSCDQPADKTLDFNFGSNMISIPYAEAIVSQEEGVCMLGFAYYGGYTILGDVFLRKAYAYFDLSEKTISLAQASYSSSSNIISA